MKRKSFLFVTNLMLALSMVLAACGGKEKTGGGNGEDSKSEGKPKIIRVLTGGTGGKNFPLGGSFTLSKMKPVSKQMRK